MSNSPNPLRILLVDDAEDGLILIKHYLKGFEVETAANGQIAIDKFRDGKFDIILMDMEMPICDGFEATQKIRELEKERSLPRTKIIALTGHEKPEQLARCLDAGCDSHLSKPVTRELLLAKVSS